MNTINRREFSLAGVGLLSLPFLPTYREEESDYEQADVSDRQAPMWILPKFNSKYIRGVVRANAKEGWVEAYYKDINGNLVYNYDGSQLSVRRFYGKVLLLDGDRNGRLKEFGKTAKYLHERLLFRDLYISPEAMEDIKNWSSTKV